MSSQEFILAEKTLYTVAIAISSSISSYLLYFMWMHG